MIYDMSSQTGNASTEKKKNILMALARERKERRKVMKKLKSPAVTRTPGLGSLMDHCATIFCLFVFSGYI